MSLLFNTLSRFHSFSSKEQASFNFMAAVTICSDFGAQENSLSLFPLFAHEVMGPDAMIFIFLSQGLTGGLGRGEFPSLWAP